MSGHGKANLYRWSVAWPEGRVPRVRASVARGVGSDHDALVFNQILGQSYSPAFQSNSNDSSLTRSCSRGSGTDESWLSMRVTLALAVLAICLSLGGCSRPKQTAYAKPRPSPLPYPTKVSSLKQSPLPVRKGPEPTKVTAVKPSLPPKKPPQSPSATPEAKFRAAQEKAKLSGVHTLTQKDIDGLSPEQIKELRGY
jgi:hypothetical protein